jgi:CRP/FNR family cyclic AMP-dependent transcriptional regulator
MQPRGRHSRAPVGSGVTLGEMDDRRPTFQEIDDLFELAQRFVKSERYDEAADLLLLALRIEPKSLPVKLALGEVRKLQQQQGGGPSRSLRDVLRETFRRNAIDAAHFLGLAELYAERGENSRAIECLEVAKAKDLANPSYHALHGRLLFRRKNFEAAAEEFRMALRLNPFDRHLAESLGRTEQERRQFEASLSATVHAFLLLNEGDQEGARRLRRRIQTLKQILGWGNRELSQLFKERQEYLHTAFDRLEWHRERFLEQGGNFSAGELLHTPPSPQEQATGGGGRIQRAGRLRRLKIWSHLSDAQLFQLTQVIEDQVYDAGTLILGHQSQGRDIYILERGEVTIQRATSYGTFPLGAIEPGGLFGESSFITGQGRASDALAVVPSQLFRIDADALEAAVQENPELGVQVYWSFWHSLAQKLRRTNEGLKSFFSSEAQSENFLTLRKKAAATAAAVKIATSDKIRLFRDQGLSRRELMTLATFSHEERFAPGASIFQEGDDGSEMYIVLEGRAIISKYIPGGGEEALAILDRGEFFGEMSLIDGAPRSADARAYGGPLTVLRLDQATVREVLAMDAHAALEFLQLLCRLIANRLREIDEKVVGWKIMSGERNEESVSA